MSVEKELEAVFAEADKAWAKSSFSLGETQERIFKTAYLKGYTKGHKSGFYTGMAVGAVVGVALAAVGYVVSK